MTDDRRTTNDLVVRARLLRRRCVEVHNQYLERTGESVLMRVSQCLPVVASVESQGPEHQLLSCFGFWGDDQLGGSRRGVNRELEQTVPAPVYQLHCAVGSSSFGAWECESVDGQMSTWSAVGPRDPESRQVALVTDVRGRRATVAVDQVRVGWAFRDGGDEALMFSLALPDASADRVRSAARRHGWNEPVGRGRGRFVGIEYRRDLLSLVVDPDLAECGLDDYYFLPAGLRHYLPSLFAGALVEAMVDCGYDPDTSWHTGLATMTSQDPIATLSPRFDQARHQAASTIGHYTIARLDIPHLRQLVTDAEIAAALGLDEDWTIDLSGFRPIGTHPLTRLELDDAFFESAPVGPNTPIGRARDQVAGDWADRLTEAIDHHRSRLRWVALAEYAAVRRTEEPAVLRGTPIDVHRILWVHRYADLYEASVKVFGSVIADRRLADILADRSGLARRVERALANDGAGERPVRVRQLPPTQKALAAVQGIGAKSVEGIIEELEAAMIGWADSLRAPSPNAADGGADGLQDGLDELDELFGG